MINNFQVLGSWFVLNNFMFVVTKKNFQKMWNFKNGRTLHIFLDTGQCKCFKLIWGQSKHFLLSKDHMFLASILPNRIFQAKNQKKLFIFEFGRTKKIGFFHTFGHFSKLFWYQTSIFCFILIFVLHLSNSMSSAVWERSAEYSRTY